MKQIKFKYLMMAFVVVGGLFTACDDNGIEVAEADEGRYTISDELLGFITDSKGKRLFSNVDFRTNGETQLFLHTNKTQTRVSTVTVTYDASVLDEYNQKNGSNYEAYPQSFVSFDNGAKIALEAGELKSPGMKVFYTSDGSLDPTKNYVVPLRITNTGDIKFNEADATRLIFVKDLTGLPDTQKSTGAYILSCMEVNGTNPLNNLSFTLSPSGKYLFDGLAMFSSNVKYDQERKRVYLSHNENNQALLDGYDKYLKPLQDAGMHVFLSLLGDGSSPGMGNLTAETSKAFAQEIKNICDAYNLDGVFFDDEYSNTTAFVGTPGFATNSAANASRLVYEIKKAQPHRLTVVFRWALYNTMQNVTEDGVTYIPGDFTDYVFCNYGTSSWSNSSCNGLPIANVGLRSQEFALSNFATEANMRTSRNAGYLSHMIFDMNPFRSNFSNQLTGMQRAARAYCDEELVFDGITYPKDW